MKSKKNKPIIFSEKNRPSFWVSKKHQVRNILEGVPAGISMLDINAYQNNALSLFYFNKNISYINHLVRIKPQNFKIFDFETLIKHISKDYPDKFGRKNTLCNSFSPWYFGFVSPHQLSIIEKNWLNPWKKAKESL
jgi:hypothetical protein